MTKTQYKEVMAHLKYLKLRIDAETEHIKVISKLLEYYRTLK